MAIPTAFYNPATGEVALGGFDQRGDNPYDVVVIESSGGNLLPAPQFIEGVYGLLDDGDFPHARTYFQVGPTVGEQRLSLGPIVVSGTDVNDLSAFTFISFSNEFMLDITFVSVPEPDTLALVLCAVLTLTRRQHRREPKFARKIPCVTH